MFGERDAENRERLVTLGFGDGAELQGLELFFSERDSGSFSALPDFKPNADGRLVLGIGSLDEVCLSEDALFRISDEYVGRLRLGTCLAGFILISFEDPLYAP